MNRLLCVSSMVFALGAGCGDDEAAEKDPIKIGAAFSLTGEAGSTGVAFQKAAEVAVATINAAGGVDGHMLELIVRDTATDPAVAATATQELIDAGVVAIIGPVTSGETSMAFPVAQAANVPMISPSSTATSLITANDGGYLFRNAPNDAVQSIAMSYYMRNVRSPVETTVVILHEESNYGRDLADAFEAEFEAAGGTVPMQVEYMSGLVDDQGNVGATSLATIDAALATLHTADAPLVLVAGQGKDIGAIMARWDAVKAMPAYDNLNDQRWFLSDGGKNNDFFTRAPASMVDMEGTFPTSPRVGDALAVFVGAFEAAQDGQDPLVIDSYTPYVWDAVHLVALALLKQSVMGADAFGGDDLRTYITDVSGPPGQVKHAGNWVELVTQVKRGADINYDGATGPNDFDANGETVGPYEVWKVDSVGASGTSSRVNYLEITIADSGQFDVECFDPAGAMCE